MEEIKLDVQVRDQVGSRKIKRLRRERFIPAVVYGGKKDNSTNVIRVERRAYEGIIRLHKGQNVIFHLNIYQGDQKIKDYPAIVKEEQHDPVSNALLHIDFHRISLTEKIEVKVPVEAVGVPVGVKRDGGSLEHVLWELAVVCLPVDIPQKIEVEVSHLEIGDAIHIKDITLPPGVETKHDPEAILLSVIPPMKEELITPTVEEGAPAEPEVIKEKKEKEAGAKPEEKKEEKKAEEKKPAEKKE